MAYEFNLSGEANSEKAMRSFNIGQSIRQRWNEARAKLKKRYVMLTDDDLVLKAGRETELIGRLQNKLGVQKDEVMKILAEL
jgi:uncharacterized protein YjbJ (UPF0337 family)